MQPNTRLRGKGGGKNYPPLNPPAKLGLIDNFLTSLAESSDANGRMKSTLSLEGIEDTVRGCEFWETAGRGFEGD